MKEPIDSGAGSLMCQFHQGVLSLLGQDVGQAGQKGKSQ